MDERQITEAIIEDARRAPDLIVRLFELDLDHVNRLVVLAAGVLGVVIPVLANSNIATAPWRLHRAVYWVSTSMVLGVLATGVTRGSIAKALRVVNEAHGEFAYNVGHAIGLGDESEIAKA